MEIEILDNIDLVDLMYSAIGEVTGALAVVALLLDLTIQTKSYASALRATAAWDA